ncbi:hypothetical protein AMAG_07248 [Allomyces macrogynus ATCC 38327]|uniref:Uncharacterized protein n=1 Tax=Allomyces macrogynus (strain ATCC 38327) TaxID=578462 RepID=A0A0L0SHM1_ALLM3|nr:hypothetical protein AMAG_07248 [Allomyces macrogynus ATCC 38327]|eukprot:KNE61986.1 hypothetical protein AMAG_07248 [Allomyces macrogynus ATCC 38327]
MQAPGPGAPPNLAAVAASGAGAPASRGDDEWTRRLDVDLRVLVSSLEDAIDMARIKTGGEDAKDRATLAREQLQLHHVAASALNAVYSLSTLATEVKQLLLLGDASTRLALAHRRAAIVTKATREANQALAAVAREVDEAMVELETCLWADCAPPSSPSPVPPQPNA